MTDQMTDAQALATISAAMTKVAHCHDAHDLQEAHDHLAARLRALSEQQGEDPFAFIPHYIIESVRTNIRRGESAVFTAYTEQHDPRDVPMFCRPQPAAGDAVRSLPAHIRAMKWVDGCTPEMAADIVADELEAALAAAPAAPMPSTQVAVKSDTGFTGAAPVAVPDVRAIAAKAVADTELLGPLEELPDHVKGVVRAYAGCCARKAVHAQLAAAPQAAREVPHVG